MTGNTDFLRHLFNCAVASAQPVNCLPPHLPDPPETGDLVILATGKAGAAMARAALDHYHDTYGFPREHIRGLATTRHGYGCNTAPLDMIEAGHPLPDRFSQSAAMKSLEIAASAQPGDLVLVLISGGGSALWSAPRPPLDLAAKQGITKALLRSGATISEINCVRKHLSLIKGGRLAAALQDGVRMVTVAISDVPGDDPAAIASGPTVPDPSDGKDACKICDHYGIELPGRIRDMLIGETPVAGFESGQYHLAATPALALEAARIEAEKAGFAVQLLGDALEGEARTVAREQAALAVKLARSDSEPALLLSGGELTVTVTGGGRGGPNQEFALSLAIALNGAPNIDAIACDSDGADGGSGAVDDPAGARITPATIHRADGLGLSAVNHLENNDSTGFFEALNDLIFTGPTYTNVNDFRAIMVNGRLR